MKKGGGREEEDVGCGEVSEFIEGPRTCHSPLALFAVSPADLLFYKKPLQRPSES